MGGGHAHHLQIAGDTLLHRLPAHAKIVGLVTFALAVVATPAPGWVPLGTALVIGVALVVRSGAPGRHVGRRLLVEVPFLIFAVVLPFVATGERTSIGPVTVSAPGLMASWLLVAKATSAVLAATAFSVTTTSRDLVAGLQRLRLPATLVAILSFMLRYLSVVGDEMTRMRIARESRGFRSRSVRSWGVLGRSLGSLFIRSFERGDRVHVAMLSRGWTGRLPVLDETPVAGRTWLQVLTPAALVLCVAAFLAVRP